MTQWVSVYRVSLSLGPSSGDALEVEGLQHSRKLLSTQMKSDEQTSSLTQQNAF